ncbi:hypothetical protein [Chryseolinea soli]|uniref:Uncharacterized protein n=1 Tax=Chryseolinea soli TaxID=2321403 RepID=A0A385SJX7_9BACT|nr:hypothetical protein [Chryseolinea soli]AYB31212.1 hypothetical protein D4L85_11765 [Chryseolinea soli]
MNFEAYLTSKKIDSAAFQRAEPVLWGQWQTQFEQMHPNSFTIQKLNLINPIRRKYQLKEEAVKVEPKPPVIKTTAADPLTAEKAAAGSSTPTPDATTPDTPEAPPATPRPKPAVPRPVFKPKPKLS